MTLETVSTAVTSILDYLFEKFGIAVELTKDNLVPILQDIMNKYIAWRISASTVAIVICGVVILLCIGAIILDIKEDFDGILIVLSLIISIICIIIIIVEIFIIIKCNTMPELAFFDYIKNMISNK